MKRMIFTILILFNLQFLSAQEMNNEKMEAIFELVADTLAGQTGQWQMYFGQIPMMCITDEFHNRMRIISPVKKVEESTPAEIMKCMEANFHSALDVKYAVADGHIWSAFIHPLRELSREQLFDAMVQVRAASINFGDSFSSTDLVFPKSEEKKRKLYKN